MQIVKRFLVLAATAMTVAAFAVPASAQAHSATCVFEGLAVNVVPGVMLVGGSGDYDISTPAGSPTAQCEFDGSGMQPSTIQSRGQFVNTLCGTGTWWSGFDDAPGSSPDYTVINAGGGTAEITSAEYTITFVAGHGAIKFHKVNGSTEAGGDDVDGYVSAVPTAGTCQGGMGSLALSGWFHIEW